METTNERALPPDIPAEVVPYLREAGYLEPDPLAVGDPAPEVPFYTPDGEQIRVRDLQRGRPAVLVFGSHT